MPYHSATASFFLSYYVATLKKTPCRKSLNWMSHHSSATRLVEHTYLKREFIVTILKIRLQAKSAQKYVYNLGALVFTLLRLFSSSLAFIACMLDSPEGFTQKQVRSQASLYPAIMVPLINHTFKNSEYDCLISGNSTSQPLLE